MMYQLGMALYDGDDDPIECITTGGAWNGWDVILLTLDNLITWLDGSIMSYIIRDNGDVWVYGTRDDTLIRRTINMDGEWISVYNMDGYAFRLVEESEESEE